MTNRQGVGRMRHIDIGLLWIQSKTADKQIEYVKVAGDKNPADMMTKHLDWAGLEKYMRIMRWEHRSAKQ